MGELSWKQNLQPQSSLQINAAPVNILTDTFLGISGRMHSSLTASSASLCSSPSCHDHLPSFDPTLTASFSPEPTKLFPPSVSHHLVLFGSHISPLGFSGGSPFKECCDLTSPGRVTSPSRSRRAQREPRSPCALGAEPPEPPDRSHIPASRAPEVRPARPAGPARCPQTGLSSSGEALVRPSGRSPSAG